MNPNSQPTPISSPTNVPLRRSSRTSIRNPKYFSSQVLNAVLNKDTGNLEEYRHLIKGIDAAKWKDACSKEFARLTKGRKKDNTPGTNTLVWKHPRELPKEKTPTYMRVCANYRPQKADPYRVRCTVGGNLIKYQGPTRTPNADITTFKLFVNSVISTPNAKFMDMDLKDFYLESTMPEPEYMLVPFSLFPEDIVEEYNIRPLVHRGMVLAQINKGMYGLPQAGRLAYEQLKEHLAKAGYVPAGHTPGLFKHITKPIQFILVVDDFGVKFVSQDDALHLINHLKTKYTATISWEGKLFCGIAIKWDYNKRTVELSMPNYVKKALLRFNHPHPNKPEHSPHPWTAPQYGAKQQLTDKIVPFEALTPKQKLWVQEVVGVFLFYARAIDSTMLTAVGSIAASLTNSPFSNLKRRINQFLNYAATHPNASIKFVATQMHLWAHSDASYLCETKARSRAGGFHFLSDKPQLPITANDPDPTPNGAVNVICKIIDAVMSSAQEAETGAGFINAKELVPMRTTLEELGHPQGPTPLQFDNKCATGIMNDDVQQRRSKSMDIRFYWLRDRTRQGQFHIHWKSGARNKGDYPTKHHPSKHHQNVRPLYVLNASTQTQLRTLLQGCAKCQYSSIAPKSIPNGHILANNNKDTILCHSHNHKLININNIR